MNHKDNVDSKVSGTVVDGPIERDRSLNKAIKKKDRSQTAAAEAQFG